MTEEEKHKIIIDALNSPVGKGWLALCMVEPIRGHPTKLYKQKCEAERILERINYWMEHGEELMKHGIEYDPSTERITNYSYDYKI